MTRKLISVLALALFFAACSADNGSSDTTNNNGDDDTIENPGDVDGLDDPDLWEGDALDPDGTEPDPDGIVPPDGDTGTPGDDDVDEGDGQLGPDADVVEQDPDVVDVVEGDTAGDTSDPPEPEGFFPSAELGLKILGPSSIGVAQALGSSIQVAGLVVGKPDAIIWESDTGQTGYAQGTPFWLSGKIDLVQGDNFITVTAVKGNEEASETIAITYNPAFRFGDILRMRPSFLYTNTNINITFQIDMGLYSNFEPKTLTLCECTQDGACVSDIHAMVDDGNPGTSGDFVGGDGIYSWKKAYNLGDPGKLCFRAHAVVKAGYQQYTAYSPVSCVDVVERVSQDTCEDIKSLQQEAQQLYLDTLATSDAPSAQMAVMNFLDAEDTVAEVGNSSQGAGVWVRYDNGILGAFDFSADGMRGTPDPDADDEYGQWEPALPVQEIQIDSKRSMILAPDNAEFGAEDEGQFVFQVLEKSECPAYVIDPIYKNDNATLQRFRTMSDYGVLSITGHGDSYFKTMSEQAKKSYDWRHLKSQEAIWTGDTIDCSKLVQTAQKCSGSGGCPAGSECVILESSGQGTSVSGLCMDHKHADLRRGRVVMGPERYGILPSFVGHYRGRAGYPSSVVYLGTCRSLWNGTMGMEFFGAGAKAVVGYSGAVTSAFAYQQGTAFWSNLVEDFRLTGDAMPELAQEDPANPGSKLRLLGAPNLTATNSDLINPSWETGDLTGWQATGDGRVISRLGITVPVEGKFMGLISTGMGYTPQTGEIYQTFCVPEDKMEMSFYWKYYSEEFKEWCGSTFQDTFEATLEGEDGMVTFVNASVDDLCPPGECMGCGGQYDGLLQADVAFDQGDVWMTHWRLAKGNVMALAGAGAVTLRFFATDKGDSIYDTVILVDTVKFK